MDVGERIKNRRKELGLSAEDIAGKMGVSPATVYRYESSDILNMKIDKLEPIANALQTTPAYLMGWETDTAEGIEAALKDILVRTGHLSPSDSLDSQKAKKYLSILGAIIQAEEEGN